MAIGNNEGNFNSVHQIKESKVAVVMFPVPAQGHLSQLLNFSRVMTSRDIPVYFLSTSVHNRQARNRTSGWDPLSISNLHFHDLYIPPNVEGAVADPNNPSKFPSHFHSIGGVLFSQRKNIIAFIRELAKKSTRVVFIIDFSICWMLSDVSFIPKTETYYFHTISAFSLHCLARTFEERQILVGGEPVEDLPPIDKAFGPESINEYFSEHLMAKKCNQGNIHYTNREIEGEFVNLLEEDRITNGEKHWAVGPLTPVTFPERKSPNNACLEWLDKQPPKSVIFVSFGTSTCFTDEEVEEIALGLERSGQKFLWIIRFADRADNFEAEDRKACLPEGFLERIKGRGKVVRDWAPQLEILGHPSTGGFLSHCGWNSCIESISMGVPLATWPMHSDQPLNAYLVTKVLKIGVPVRGYTVQERDEIVRSELVEEAVRKLMDSPEGDEMRKKAEDFSSAVKKSVQKDGATVAERSNFIAHITR